MDGTFSYSIESVIFFLAILFLAFCCGLLRGLRKYYANRRVHHIAHRRVVISHIRVAEMQRESEISGMYPTIELSNPPPYSVVSDLPPPSYDEAIHYSTIHNRDITKM